MQAGRENEPTPQAVRSERPGWMKRRGLPPRYRLPWREPFDRRIAPALVAGARVLDVGSGRQPTILPDRRPAGCRYVGLDLSRRELDKAPPHSYDETFESDVSEYVPALAGSFDLVVSWQVLEHVKPLDRALENLRCYLRPGGRLVALLSGTFSAFGLINLVVPQHLGLWAMHRLLGRDPTTVFPAYYDRCWYSALNRTLTTWQSAKVEPLYRGAGYFAFSPAIQALYLGYESWACRSKRSNLATHYLISAVAGVPARVEFEMR